MFALAADVVVVVAGDEVDVVVVEVIDVVVVVVGRDVVGARAMVEVEDVVVVGAGSGVGRSAQPASRAVVSKNARSAAGRRVMSLQPLAGTESLQTDGTLLYLGDAGRGRSGQIQGNGLGDVTGEGTR